MCFSCLYKSMAGFSDNRHLVFHSLAMRNVFVHLLFVLVDLIDAISHPLPTSPFPEMLLHAYVFLHNSQIIPFLNSKHQEVADKIYYYAHGEIYG